AVHVTMGKDRNELLDYFFKWGVADELLAFQVKGSKKEKHLTPFELADRFKPQLWVFGHHHQWFEVQRGLTRFQGLPECWHGYAVWSEKQGFVVVENFIKRHKGFWQNLFPSLFG
ncbi:MAG TPA: hypothetical protein PKO06_19860, partial [Candidatus Ozemobacteraceae bacterium]|nr:hypothetical protein [Candidatus Ozemobacteraceae bacterium]